MPRLVAAVIAVVALLVACSPGQTAGSSPVATADSADKPLATGVVEITSNSIAFHLRYLAGNQDQANGDEPRS